MQGAERANRYRERKRKRSLESGRGIFIFSIRRLICARAHDFEIVIRGDGDDN